MKLAQNDAWIFAFRALCALILLFLLLPLVVIVPLSFSPDKFFSFPPSSFSLKWYANIFTSERWLRAGLNSLLISVCATVIATCLGTLASAGLAKYRSKASNLVLGLLLLPMLVPIVITGVGIFFLDAYLGIAGTYASIIIAQALVGLPFVVLTVTATLQGFDHTLIRAALSLGASPAKAFVSILVPIIMPGVLAGALFAFAISFDEIVITLFLVSPGKETIPVQIFSGIRDSINPEITAIASLLLLISILMMALAGLLLRGRGKLNSPVRDA
ncbi:ABC transporter permease [Castellaniella sp.]|uniref:ABC transporter permease n=1 Tax=Castellaniella sp. TaxID=1955812 RepID=UPI003C73973A